MLRQAEDITQPNLVTKWKVSRGPVQCKECGMMLSCVTALEAHLARAHRDLQQKPAVCDRCGKCYTYSYTLKRHKWKCLGLRHLECEICGRVNHRLDYHKAHMLRVHGLTVL